MRGDITRGACAPKRAPAGPPSTPTIAASSVRRRLGTDVAGTEGADHPHRRNAPTITTRKAPSMSTAKKLLLAAFAAAILFALMGGTAAALRSLGSSQREIRLLARELSFGSSFGGVVVICEVAMDSTLNSLRAAKREGTIVGRGNAVILRCSRGTARVLNLPWNGKYKSILGTLPAITGMRGQVERKQVLIEYGARLENRCLIVTESESLQQVVLEARGVRRQIGNLSGFSESNVTVTKLTAESVCPFFAAEMIIEGTFQPVGGPIFVELA